MHLSPVESGLILLITVTVVAVLASRLHLSRPIAWVVAGMGLGFLPGFPSVHLDPKLFFYLFLPPILYIASWYTSWRDLRDNTRIMIFLALGLVTATTAAVAVVANYLIPGLSIAGAVVLGSIVSPPDAVSAAAIIKTLDVPRRILVVLEGESLLNDATALVLYGFAVQAVTVDGFAPTWESLMMRFLGAGVGGVLFGLGAGAVIGWLRSRTSDVAIGTALSLMTPFVLYLPAEALNLSAVLSTVAGGLYLGWRSPTMLGSATRLQAGSFWNILMFLINGSVFLLTGLQLPVILAQLSHYSPTMLASYALAVNTTVILVRLVWVYLFTYLPRLLVPGLSQRDPYPGWRNVFIIAWSGMRGTVSLAAALALPLTIYSGAAFPHRDLIIFLTFTVILTTLVIQGTSLPIVIRLLNVTDDSCERCDEVEARLRAARQALMKVENLAGDNEIGVSEEHLNRFKNHYSGRIQHYETTGSPEGAQCDRIVSEVQQFHQQLLATERQVILDMWRQGAITDEIMHRIEQDLDIQEVQLQSGLQLAPV